MLMMRDRGNLGEYAAKYVIAMPLHRYCLALTSRSRGRSFGKNKVKWRREVPTQGEPKPNEQEENKVGIESAFPSPDHRHATVFPVRKESWMALPVS